MAGTRRDDETVNIEFWESSSRDGVVTDDGDICTEKTQRLVKIPGEGIKVVNEQDVYGTL